MQSFTNLRIRSTVRPGEPGVPENVGEWYVDTEKPVSEYHKRILREYQEEEPECGWHFETRGEGTLWHRFSD